jgi:hypothetical protein
VKASEGKSVDLKQAVLVDQHGRAYAGSQRQIQTYVNQLPNVLNIAIAKSLGDAFPANHNVRWVSPLESEGYREYWDSKFLRVLGLREHSDALSLFWPNGGPHWDSLARLEDEQGKSAGCILVEAKSHVPEFYQKDTRAEGVSLELIKTSLNAAKQWFGVQESVIWTGFKNPGRCLYQYTNRLAHLYFFRAILGVPAFIVNVQFLGDPHSPTELGVWQTAIGDIHKELGLHRLPSCFANVFLPAEP